MVLTLASGYSESSQSRTSDTSSLGPDALDLNCPICNFPVERSKLNLVLFSDLLQVALQLLIEPANSSNRRLQGDRTSIISTLQAAEELTITMVEDRLADL